MTTHNSVHLIRLSHIKQLKKGE